MWRRVWKMVTEVIDRILDFLRVRKRDYQLVFGSPAGQNVLLDLMPFCRAAETCAVPGDEHRTWILEGRREVILRILNHMNLTPEQLAALYAGKQFNTMEQKQ